MELRYVLYWLQFSKIFPFKFSHMLELRNPFDTVVESVVTFEGTSAFTIITISTLLNWLNMYTC